MRGIEKLNLRIFRVDFFFFSVFSKTRLLSTAISASSLGGVRNLGQGKSHCSNGRQQGLSNFSVTGLIIAQEVIISLLCHNHSLIDVVILLPAELDLFLFQPSQYLVIIVDIHYKTTSHPGGLVLQILEVDHPLMFIDIPHGLGPRHFPVNSDQHRLFLLDVVNTFLDGDRSIFY